MTTIAKPRRGGNLATIARRVYKSTPRYKLDQLLKSESYWKRRETTAKNKLVSIRRKINSMAVELATPGSSIETDKSPANL